MDTPVKSQEPRKDRNPIFWTSVALGISIFALLRIGYVLREFNLDAASFAAGTEIRPMGVTFQLGIAWTASILFGGVCALVGGTIALIQRRWGSVLLAFLAGVATWIPMFVSNRGFDYIVQVRKLVLEP